MYLEFSRLSSGLMIWSLGSDGGEGVDGRFALEAGQFVFMSLFLAGLVFIAAQTFLVAEGRGHSLVAVLGLHCGGPSCCRARALGLEGLSSCGAWVQRLWPWLLERRLSGYGAWA